VRRRSNVDAKGRGAGASLVLATRRKGTSHRTHGLERPDKAEGEPLGKKTRGMVMLGRKFSSYWKGKPAHDAPPPDP